MKAFREIGLWRTAKFGLGTLAMVFYGCMILPQLRVAFLRIMGAQIGRNCVIHSGRFFNYYRRGFKGVRIGDNCFIGDEFLIDLAEEIELHENTTLAERVTILTHTNVGYNDHPLQEYYPPETAAVRLGPGCFVGAGVTILPGAIVGEGSLVGAGSLVRESVPPNSLAVGAPSRVLGNIKPG